MNAFNRTAVALARPLGILLCSALSLAAPSARSDEAADRQELLAMLASIESAINARDMSTVMPYIRPTSVITFQNGTVLTGPAETLGFFERMLGSADSILTDVDARAAVSAPAIFLTPDIAVAHGTLDDTFTFRGGSELDLHTLWTTTVVRDGGNWHIGSLHMSADVFDNPILHAAERAALYAAVAGFLAGLALAALFAFVKRRRRASAAP